jgi:hypothetical protein
VKPLKSSRPMSESVSMLWRPHPGSTRPSPHRRVRQRRRAAGQSWSPAWLKRKRRRPATPDASNVRANARPARASPDRSSAVRTSTRITRAIQTVLPRPGALRGVRLTALLLGCLASRRAKPGLIPTLTIGVATRRENTATWSERVRSLREEHPRRNAWAPERVTCPNDCRQSASRSNHGRTMEGLPT